MLFNMLAHVFERLEKTSSGNSMRDILSHFLKKVPNDDIDKVCYLALGTIASPYENIVLGMADQMVIKSIAYAASKDEDAVKKDFKKFGDLGTVVEKEIQNKKLTLTIKNVFDKLHVIAKVSGPGSQYVKIKTLAELLKKASSLEAKYITRIALGTLRMGVGEMTLLDSLAIAFTDDKKNKVKLERAYNVCPDIGIIAKILVVKKSVQHIKPMIGRPIKVMLAQRAKTLEEIKKRMPDGIVAEEKYDGERVQIHKGRKITFFSRRMDDITEQFPDLVKEIKKIKNNFIAEGEIIPVDKNGKLLDFQTLMKRKRRHDIEKFVKDVPVAVFFFDLLYMSKSYLDEPFVERRKALKNLFKENKILKFARHIVTQDVDAAEKFFGDCVKRGTEGIIAKHISGVYQAGTRGYNWIKWKKDYVKKLRDTFDLVIVGGFSGKGKRRGSYGALLCACYNKKMDVFETFCKLGSGFTDKQLQELPKKLKRVNKKSLRVKVYNNLKPDFWFEPALVVEVTGAEITRSPLHSTGLALRFPRFIRFREKTAEQATTRKEVEELSK